MLMIYRTSFIYFYSFNYFFAFFFRFIHLTNNSIAKYSSKFENSEIVGNMWTCDEFNNQLKVF